MMYFYERNLSQIKFYERCDWKELGIFHLEKPLWKIQQRAKAVIVAVVYSVFFMNNGKPLKQVQVILCCIMCGLSSTFKQVNTSNTKLRVDKAVSVKLNNFKGIFCFHLLAFLKANGSPRMFSF